MGTSSFCINWLNYFQMELSFWDSEDIEELIDMAMEPPTLPLP